MNSERNADKRRDRRGKLFRRMIAAIDLARQAEHKGEGDSEAGDKPRRPIALIYIVSRRKSNHPKRYIVNAAQHSCLKRKRPSATADHRRGRNEAWRSFLTCAV